MTSLVPRMSDGEARAWLALVATSELLPAALDAQLQSEAGITHFEFMVLSALSRAKGAAVTSSDLARAVYATLPRLSKVTTRMATRGLLERGPHPEDRRATAISLTREGRKVFLQALPAHLELVRASVLDLLDPSQQAALAQALETIVEALAKDPRFPWGQGTQAT